MAIKMTMADGTIIEGTAEELAALQKIAEEDAQEEVKPKARAIKSEKRAAKVGDRIVITDARPRGEQDYVVGDIFEVTKADVICRGDVRVKEFETFIDYVEYEVVVEGGSGDTLKEGDLAHVVGDTYHGEIAKGRLVEIKQGADFEGDYLIVTADGSRDYAQAESLSKIESGDAIGVGDIVRITEYMNGLPVGTVGEVVSADADGWARVSAIYRGKNSTYSFHERNVELVAKASDRADIDV